MITYMAGYPFSGKSYVVSKILDVKPSFNVIDPKNLRIDNYHLLDEASKREVNIAAWQVSIEYLQDLIKDSKNNVIYDTACSSLNVMKPIFEESKKFGHKVVYVLVIADLSVCKSRAGDLWNENMINKYKTNFKSSIPVLSAVADEVVVVHNNEEPDISGVLGVYDGVC
jgi:hypothetical protein